MSADNNDNHGVVERFTPVEAIAIAACLCALSGAAMYFGHPGVALVTVVALAFIFRP